MGTIANKLTYLNETKEQFKDKINSLGGEITNNTPFRDYFEWTNDFYNQSSDKTDLNANGIKGRTSQETTIGKNKYGITSAIPYTYNNGLPASITNWIVIDNYDLNNISFHCIHNDYYQVLLPIYQLEPNTSYTLTYTRVNTLVSDATARRWIYSIDSENNYSLIYAYNAGDEGDKTYTFTTTDTGKVAIAFGYNNTGNGCSSTINNLMLRLSTESDTYEPYTYGASPNLNYPQPVNNLNGNVSYKAEGKNILNIIDYNNFGNNLRNNGNATHTIKDNKIIVTTSSGSFNSGVYIRPVGSYVDNYDLNKTYIISFDVKANQELSFKYGYSPDTITTTIGSTTVRLFITTKIINSAGLVFYSTQNRADDIIEISNIMVSESEDVIYEKYTGIRTFNIPLKSKNIVLTNINDWESGQYNVSGSKQDTTSRIRLKELLPIKPNTTYCFDTFDTTEFHLIHNYIIRECDENGNFINNIGIINNQGTFTTRNDAYYLMVTIGTSSTQSGETFENYQTYFNEGKIKPFICLNSEIDKMYEPYYDIELCKIDTYEDKIYSNNGKFYLKKNIKKLVLKGNEDWYIYNGIMYLESVNDYLKTGNVNVPYSNYYKGGAMRAGIGTITELNKNTIALSNNSNEEFYRLFVNDDSGKTKDQYKTWLSSHNLIVYYILYTPTTIEITANNYPVLYDALKQIQDYLTSYKINKEFILNYDEPNINY